MNPIAPPTPDNPPAGGGHAEQARPGHGVAAQDPDATAQLPLPQQEPVREAESVLTGAAPSAAPSAALAGAGPAGVPVGPTVAAAEALAAVPLRVHDIEAVARSRLFTVSLASPLVEVAALLSGPQISVVAVIDAAGAPLGTITETVLVRHLGLGRADFFTTTAGEVMSHTFVRCAPEDPLSDVLARMYERGFIHVLLVEAGNRLIGVVNARDGLRALLAAGNHEEALLRNYVMGVGYQ